MSKPGSETAPRRLFGGWPFAVAALVIVATGVAVGVSHTHEVWMRRRLLATPMDEVAHHPDLVAYASAKAKPIFAHNCAGCHGADMKGLAAAGAPNLTDTTTLYGNDVFHIERTILYGIRSGQKRANDITEMPAFGQRGQLSDADIKDVVQYILKLNGRPYDDGDALAGQVVYAGKGVCFDCHAPDAKGEADYGAPDLTANVWDYGGDPKSLYNSIYYGRHGVMPTWIGKLSLAQIRALAVYIYASSHK